MDEKLTTPEPAAVPSSGAPSPGSIDRGLILGVGLFWFGLAVGVSTGLSTSEGVSQVLLSSLFSFVGGALLTYSGFRKKRSDGGPGEEIDTRRLGVGLTAFSVGLLLGLYAGIWARLDPPLPAELKARLKSERAAVASGPVPAGLTDVFSLHGDTETICAAVRIHQLDGTYDSPEGALLARGHLEDLFGEACTQGEAR
jgi:hypothetical protein